VADQPNVGFESPVVRPGEPLGGELALIDESAATKVSIRASDDSAVAAELEVPFAHSLERNGVLVVGMRPEEWLLLGDTEPVRAVAAGVDPGSDGLVTVIDITHGRAMFRLSGDESPAALEKVCSIDFGDHMTPDGAAVGASVAKVACDLVRNDRGEERSYLIMCDRSLGQYLWDALRDACKEFTPQD